MINTYLEMQTELAARLMVASNSTTFSATRLGELLNNANQWATQMFIWLELVRGRMTNSKSGYEYYDYPSDFRTGTIIRLEVDNEPYERKNFEDYLDFKKNNPGSQEKIFAHYGRQYFIYPTPTANGTNNISVWGAIQAPALTQNTDTTIFSSQNMSGNEAIIKKAFSVAIKRIDSNLSTKEEQEGLGLLAVLNKKQWEAYQRDKRIQHPRFDVPDYMKISGGTQVGNFSYNL